MIKLINLLEVKIDNPIKDLSRTEWVALKKNKSEKELDDYLVKLGYPTNSRHLYVIQNKLNLKQKQDLIKWLKNVK